MATAICTVFLSACSHQPSAEHHPHWSYQGEESPAHWGELAQEFAVCGSGHLQSPVDLSTKAKVVKAHLHYQYSPMDYILENNGHTVQLTPQTKSVNLILEGKEYTLQQFHVHTPGEHTLNSKQFPMELHFVHTDSHGEIAVIAVMFAVGKENSHLNNLLKKQVKVGEKVALTEKINVQDLFPKNTQHLSLKGSLTTPPCTEGVNWIVMEQPLQASYAQLTAMEKMIGLKNNRPLQSLGDRIVVIGN
ncbi:carbonic anhydrase [Chelonobacter oris]|uniref:carbonic anhydrase n=1 Tax=Chelonobacter oris TaxID=505317 RepID=A0A0A3ASR9_9PAST|nr:carbonic anhydrase [Chelonobacter oris]